MNFERLVSLGYLYRSIFKSLMSIILLSILYFIFSRSPYTHNQMIAFMGEFPEKIHSAIYLEGGPETSLYIDLGDHCIEKIGSYVSQTYAHDRNADFWELPNVIGIRVK